MFTGNKVQDEAPVKTMQQQENENVQFLEKVALQLNFEQN
jgi:hypothetical protein